VAVPTVIVVTNQGTALTSVTAWDPTHTSAVWVATTTPVTTPVVTTDQWAPAPTTLQVIAPTSVNNGQWVPDAKMKGGSGLCV
jgi:hypothetical protein